MLGFLFGNLSQKVITKSLKFFKKEYRKGRKKTGSSFRRGMKELDMQLRDGRMHPRAVSWGMEENNFTKEKPHTAAVEEGEDLNGTLGLGTGRKQVGFLHDTPSIVNSSVGKVFFMLS